MISKRLLGVLFFAFTMLIAGPAFAREWAIVGPRALGMGGAGVAVANDSTASYWNPAAFGFFSSTDGGEYGKRGFSVNASGGLGAQVHEDLGLYLDNLADFSYAAFDTTGSMTNAANVADYIQLINGLKTFNDNENRALSILMDGGLNFQVKNYGIGAYAFGDISARGSLDLDNIAPVSSGTTYTLSDFTNPANYGCSPCSPVDYLSTTEETSLRTFLSGLGWGTTEVDNFVNAIENGLQTAENQGYTIPSDILTQIETVAQLGDLATDSGGSFADNTSTLYFRGISIVEFPLTYGRAINDDVAVGANVKFMKARVYNTSVDIFDTDFADALDQAQNDYADSQNFGVDLGVLYRFGDALRFGMVARNVNAPSFDMNPLLPGDEDSISEEAQVRAGVAYRPIDSLLLAMDFDVTENDTNVTDSYKSRMLGVGAEWNLMDVLKLRGGAYTNMAESDIGIVYTAGLGLNLWAVQLDLGASLSGSQAEIDGSSVPEEVRVEMALSSLF